MNKKVYVVIARYSDYEWNRDDLVGVYSTKKGAAEAKKSYTEDIIKKRNLENPLTEEEQDIPPHELSDESFDKWINYDNLQQNLGYFEDTFVQEIEVDNDPIMFENN